VTPHLVVGIVLAGGASSRFGSNKLAATLDGRPLLDHALGAVAEVAGPVVLMIAPGAPVPPLPAGLDARLSVARDDALHGGPLAGLVAGLRHASALDGVTPDAVALVLGGDMPGARPDVLRLLIDALAARPDVGALALESDAPAPLPLAIRHSAWSVPARLLDSGRRSLLALLDEVGAGRVPPSEWRALDPAGDTLRDVDTPADL
jgi:molybdopterin-guanine dinucleotide biosynthesis protein A